MRRAGQTVLLQIALQVSLVSYYMHIHLFASFVKPGLRPSFEPDSPKEDTLHDSQFVSSMIPDGCSPDLVAHIREWRARESGPP